MLENVSVDWQVADYIPTGNWQISLAHSPLPDAPTYLQLLHHSALHKISTPLPTFISWTRRWMSLNSPRLFCHPLLWLGLLQRQLGPVGSLPAPLSTFPAAGLRPLLPPLHLSTSLHPASLLYCPPSTCHPPAPPPSICPPPSPSLSHPSAAPLLNFAYLLLHNRISETENKMKGGVYPTPRIFCWREENEHLEWRWRWCWNCGGEKWRAVPVPLSLSLLLRGGTSARGS